jgi:hypothetical protein
MGAKLRLAMRSSGFTVAWCEANEIGTQMNHFAVLLAGATLLGISLSAHAQGTYPNGIRGGYTGTAPSSTTSTSTSPASPSNPAPATKNLGTGQGRTEGAMGLTPQLQREMGIGRQQ